MEIKTELTKVVVGLLTLLLFLGNSLSILLVIKSIRLQNQNKTIKAQKTLHKANVIAIMAVSICQSLFAYLWYATISILLDTGVRPNQVDEYRLGGFFIGIF